MGEYFESTPTQPDALTSTQGVTQEAVEIQVTKKESGPCSMSLPTKLAHLLAVVVSGVIALFVSATLADGRSVITLKDAKDLPRITDEKLMKKGLDYRADELLGT